MLRAYLDAGGKLLVLLDPPDGPDAENRDNLIGLIADWGIEVGQNIVVDVSGVGQLLGTDATVPVAASYPQHPITDRFALLTAFPLARSVTPLEGGANGRVATSFAETSPRSWAESNLDLSGGEVAMEEDQGDVPGPVSIAAAVSAIVEADAATPADEDTATDGASGDEGSTEDEADDTPAEARLAVFGDSDFAANGSLGIQGNREPRAERAQLARRTGKPDLDPAARAGGSAHHVDRRPAVPHLHRVAHPYPGPYRRRRRVHLVAEAVVHAGPAIDARAPGRGHRPRRVHLLCRAAP